MKQQTNRGRQKGGGNREGRGGKGLGGKRLRKRKEKGEIACRGLGRGEPGGKKDAIIREKGGRDGRKKIER